MNLTRQPIRQKVRITKRKDPCRLEMVAAMPCVICFEFDMRQNSPTEVHHCKSGRFGQKKTPDYMTIPLCHSHHNKLRVYPGDEGKIGFHNMQATWESLYGEDTEWLNGWRNACE